MNNIFLLSTKIYASLYSFNKTPTIYYFLFPVKEIRAELLFSLSVYTEDYWLLLRGVIFVIGLGYNISLYCKFCNL